jgi:CcmD family protein
VTTAEKYVTAAYLVVFVVVLGYVLIVGAKVQRLERELDELTELARRRKVEREQERVAVG